MSRKVSKSAKAVREIIKSTGTKGLLNAAKKKLQFSSYRILCRNHILNSLVNGIFRDEISNPKLDLAYLELTNNCNLHCKMCTIKKTQGKIGYMSKSLFESCVDQLSQIGVRTLFLHGVGESLLHPHFKDYLKYAINQRDHGGIREVAWVDNGMLFSQNISDLTVDLKVDAISFSIDGVGQINDSIRLGAKYSVIERNIKYLIKKRGKADKPIISLGMVDYEKTEEQKNDVYREWVTFVDQIALMPSLLPDNTWENKSEFCDKQLTSPPPFCQIPFQMMTIRWNGEVTGCCLDWSYTMNLGNATIEPLKQIWQGSRFQALRKAVLAKTYPTESLCRKCEFWQINFKPAEEIILDGKAVIKYGYLNRMVTRKS